MKPTEKDFVALIESVVAANKGRDKNWSRTPRGFEFLKALIDDIESREMWSHVENNYHRQWFIDFFERIPESEWGTTDDEARTHAKLKSCIGHLLPPVVDFDRQYIVNDFTVMFPTSIEINDGLDPRFQQPTAKARILAALKTKWL